MLSKLSIKQKLILIMLIPLVVVVLLAAKLSLDSFNNLKNLQSLDKLVVLSVKIGNLVHETQKERAISSGFISISFIELKKLFKSDENPLPKVSLNIVSMFDKISENELSEFNC